MNNSVKETARIAKKYGYKSNIVYVYPKKAFLSISDNFLKSPYPRHITSKIRSAEYVEKIYNEL